MKIKLENVKYVLLAISTALAIASYLGYVFFGIGAEIWG